MSDFLRLFSVQLKVRFGFADLLTERKKNPKAFLKKILMLILVAISFATLGGMWGWVLYAFFAGLTTLGMIDLALLLPFLVGMIVVLIFGITAILGILFMSKDIEFLASLPIKQGTVFASKFMLVYLYELAVMLFFMIPAIIIYGILADMGAAFYIKSFFVTLLLPMLPLAIATLLSLFLMRFTGLAKRRELFMVVGGFILTIGMVVGQNLLTARLSNMDQNELLDLLSKSNGVVLLFGRAFPPAFWAVKASVASGLEGLTNWALYLTSTLGAFAISYIVGSKIYLSGALSHLESSGHKKTRKLTGDNFASGSAFKAIALREFRLIIRSPIYALNSLIGVLLFPVMLFLIPISGDTDLNSLASLLSGANVSYIFLASLGVGFMVCTTNLVSSTAISREGSHFWLSKVIPLSYRVQAYGKLLFSWIVDVATIVLCTGVAFFTFPMFRAIYIMAAACAIIGSVAINAAKMMVDISRPKLKWSGESEAIKQNFNGFLGMLVSIIAGLAFVLIALLLAQLPNVLLAYILLLLVVMAISAGSLYLLGIISTKKFKDFEPG